MIVYVDSSALVKRVVAEAESDAAERLLARHAGAGDVLVSSSLAWIEVERALRALRGRGVDVNVVGSARDALSGIAERSLSADVVSLARRIGPDTLRSLDAIHVSTAVLVDADALITFDDRLADAADQNGITVAAV